MKKAEYYQNQNLTKLQYESERTEETYLEQELRKIAFELANLRIATNLGKKEDRWVQECHKEQRFMIRQLTWYIREVANIQEIRFCPSKPRPVNDRLN